MTLLHTVLGLVHHSLVTIMARLARAITQTVQTRKEVKAQLARGYP